MRASLLGLILILFASIPAAADEAAAWDALRAGGHVALMRHALAPGGAGDPDGFRLDDCRTQRNLSPEGREDARRVGERLRAEKIAVGKVFSSPWCRCIDTATLMDLGEVEISETFSNAFVLAGERERLTAGAREIIAGWRGPGALIVVTHGANIQALTGQNADSGEMVVVRAEAGAVVEVGRIPVPPG
jgi:phosphohistidine phosphatase SixA